MEQLAVINRALGLVPSWCWAAAVLALAALALHLGLGQADALADASRTHQQLIQAQLDTVSAVATERNRAQAREHTLISKQQEVTDALAQARAESASRADDLAGRVRQLARPVAVRCGSDPGPRAQAAGPGDGHAGPGLPDLAAPGLVVLDGAAQLELATFAQSAADTGQTLMSCRALLHNAWRATN